jgi:hypothetical protein
MQSAVSWAVQESTSTVQESTPTIEAPETEQTTSSQESEAKGIIPFDADTLISTQPITPTSVFTEKSPFEQAKDELARAQQLWGAGHSEAASDTALEAYDDLIEMHRVPGLKRAKFRALIYQAATIYVDAGITYIKNFVRKTGGSQDGIEEGRARLEDLRDVARNYNDLNKKLNTAIEQLSSPPVSSTK